MLISKILEDIIHNAALLLICVYLFDLARFSWRKVHGSHVLTGLLLGICGLGLMMTPLDMGEGIVYDTRSVFIGLVGLFFSPLELLIAGLMMVAYRLHLGGLGMLTGSLVIVACGLFGLLTKRAWEHRLAQLRWHQLLFFGLVCSIIMLLLQFTLPEGRASYIIPIIITPVLLVFPVAGTLVGVLIVNRLKQNLAQKTQEDTLSHLDALYRNVPIPICKEDFSLVRQALKKIEDEGHKDFVAYFQAYPDESWRLASLVRICDVNDEALEQVGARSMSEVTFSPDRVFNQQSAENFVKQLIEMWHGVSRTRILSSMHTLQGDTRYVEVCRFVIPGHEATWDRVITTTLDLTENLKAQAKLLQSHSLLKNLTDQVPGMLYQFRRYPDGHMSVPFVTLAIEHLFGLSPEMVAEDATQVFERILPEDRLEVERTIEESARTFSTWQCQFRVTRADGQVRWLSGIAQPRQLEDGSILWHGYVHDITDSKRIEERLRLTSRVFDAAGEGVLITDAQQNIIAVNTAFSRVTGYSEEDVLGQKPSILSSGRHDESFYRSMWVTLAATGTWAGDIWNRRKSGEIYPEWLTMSVVKNDQDHVQYYVAVFSDLSEIRRAQNLAERMAMEDVLTGLANRSAFVLRMDRFLGELRAAKRHSVMVLFDLDRFKEINQSEGLDRGDAVLKAVADTLQQRFGGEHLVARVGADEFAVLVYRQLATHEEAGRMALDIFEQARSGILSGMPPVGSIGQVEISAGIVLLPGEDDQQTADILQAADWAASQAKSQGGGKAVFFASVMGQEIRERYRLEQELRQAAERHELRLFLQPQVNAEGKQVSAEALIRWQHPQRGLMPPGMFITLAEEAGFISVLEHWMFREICQLLVRLEADGRGIKVSLNISAHHFEREDFVDEVRRQIAQSGVNPSLLVFEITESVVIENIGDVTEKMLNLGMLGIQFSLDDFGTGYSSLSYLKRLPIHELKIDRSFITDAPHDMNDAALVETILGVARTLRLRVVAEGVETQAQADFLNAHGNVIHQGYLYDKPLPVAQWLEKYFP
ncbi:MAG: EAL domain-containing protein [Rhodocyclaceae bacterium]|nr:EAL domain-containing protein [Rhodocyclaceae bacterium]